MVKTRNHHRLAAAVALVASLGPTIAFGAAFRAVEIDKQIGVGYGVAVADVNGDQKPDIVLADSNMIVWYQNPDWTKHVLAEKLTPRDHVCIAAADVDGDGRAEIAVGAEWNPGDTRNSGAVFHLVPPADRTQRWTPVRLHHEPTVHRMRWVRGAGNYELVVVPLHGRGNNAASGEGDGVRVLAYQKPADASGTWSTNLLDDSMHKTHNFDPVQWDADPEQELIVGGKEGVFLLDRQGARTTRRQLAGAEGGGAGEVRLGRLRAGGKYIATVEPMHGNAAAVYTMPARDTGGLWERQLIETNIVDGHALACGDLLGAGYDQIVLGWRAMNRPGARVGIKLYTSEQGEGKAWSASFIDDNGMACEDLCLADLNGDNRLDVVAAGRATKNVKIYFNETARPR